MRVIYSVGARLAGGGIGNTAYQAVKAIASSDALEAVFVSSACPMADVPQARIHTLGVAGRILKRFSLWDRSGYVEYLSDELYDRWVSRQLVACDIFHGWGNMSFRSLMRARRLGAVTLVERASTHPIEQGRLLKEAYRRYGIEWQPNHRQVEKALREFDEADAILVPSEFVRQSFRANGVEERRLMFTPFGVDVERFVPREASYAQVGDRFRCLFVGQVGIRKGALDLLEAWRRLRWRDAELVLVGRVESVCKAYLAGSQFEESVRLMGHMADPVPLYRSADLFVFPTIEEGSALVTYEAMACGLAMITTPNAGAIARHGREAVLVPAGDIVALAEAMTRLREEPALREQLGKSARRMVEAYSWDAYGKRLMQIYHRLLEEKSTTCSRLAAGGASDSLP